MELPPKLSQTRKAPPPLPNTNDVALINHLKFCANTCFVVGIIGCIAVIGGIFKFVEGIGRIDVFIFAVGVMFIGFSAAIALSNRKKYGEMLATICFVLMLFAIPLGTVFGAIGLSKLSKIKTLFN